MSRERVTSKATSLPLLSDAELASIRPEERTRTPWLRMDSFDRSGLILARASTIKFCAIVVVLIVSAAHFASTLQ